VNDRGVDSLPGPDTNRFRVGLLLLLLGATMLLFPALGAAPFERAEIYFMDGARSMVERGDYLVPHYMNQPFFDKPPLTYWLMALSFQLFGFEPGAARLVPALATLGTLLATVWLGCLLFDRRSALAGALVLTTTVVFVAFGRVAMSDMLLAFWTTLSMALAVSALRAPHLAWPVAALGAALGLGFLTKGPVALLLPGLGLALLLWQRRAAVRSLSGKALAVAALVFAVAGFGWFVVLLARLGWGPLEYFFLHENLERFAGDTYDDGRTAWYYLVTYLGEGLPWSLVLPAALARDLRRGPPQPGRDGARLLAAWVGLMLVPLSLSRGKLDYYLLPLYPAVSLIVGRYLARPSWGSWERVWGRVVLIAIGAGLALLLVLPTPLPDPWLPGPAARVALWVAVAGSAVAVLALASRPTPRRVLRLLSAVPATLFVISAAFFLPAFRSAQPNARIVEDVAREHRYRADARVVVCQGAARAQRDILFHVRVPVAHRCELWSFAASRYPYMILATKDERASVGRGNDLRHIASYDYVPADALTLRGLTPWPTTRRTIQWPRGSASGNGRRPCACWIWPACRTPHPSRQPRASFGSPSSISRCDPGP